MSNRIVRETLPLGDNNQIRYSLHRGNAESEGLSPLLLCLHPGWEGAMPSPFYGEGFLYSIFIPAFAESGAIIAAPDCPTGAWNNPDSMAAVLALLEHLLARERVDPTRISLVGYSAGGWGAWYMLLDHADKFASAVMFATLPVIDPVDHLFDNFQKCEELLTSRMGEWVRLLPPIPIYMVHSRADQLFNYSNAELVIQALKNDHRKVRFASVSAVGHFDGSGFVEALRATVPWLQETWNSESADLL